MKKPGFTMLILLILLLPLSGWADSSSQDQSVNQLEETVVTSGRIEEKKQDVTTNITVYTSEDIEQSSIQDLSDLLLKEGFYINEYPNSTISVGIRGLSTDTHGNDLASNVLILINGRRAGTGNIAKITMNNVERIEIIRGPGSVQYGAAAMGGVINIITQKGWEGFTASVEATMGSWDYAEGAMDFAGGVNWFDYSVSASKSSKGDFKTGDGIKYDNTGYDSKENIDFDAGITFSPKNRIGFSFSSHDGNQIGSPGKLESVNTEDYVDHALESFDIYYDGQTQDDFLLWKLRYFSGKDEYYITYPSSPSKNYTRDTKNQGLQAQITARWDLIDVTGGLDWVDYGIESSNGPGKENTFDNPAFFILTKTRLMEERLILSLGGRYDKYEIESTSGKTKNESNLSWSFGTVYKFSESLSIRGNIADAFRMPTADQLFSYTDYSAFGWGIWSGNEDLDPENSRTYEIGIDYAENSLSASLTYFYTEFKDKISYESIGGGVTQYKNIEGATISGFEGSIKYNISDRFNWAFKVEPYGSFTIFDEYTDDSTGENLTQTPDWSASYGLSVSNREIGLSSRLNFTHYGEQDMSDGTQLNPVDVADWSISKRLFSFEKYGEVALKGEIVNLFDEDYALVQGYPSPGRTFYLGVKYTY
ncbi:TonB-dependent receptor plug domain-containing protein [Desulfospira joergensenii]|uniref:TonB-dependent receptor plug domain-containing protein n=1 Tax=Desulfospira joergensenii TaxID=53329 RepID=UPI0003B7BA19|nr:TonB-dependent receptor [Desulfospira joergensenii]